MPKVEIEVEKMNTDMARAFAKDAYRQMREATEETIRVKGLLAEAATLLSRHLEQHDASAKGGTCACTICKATDALMPKIDPPRCQECGEAADGTHEGTLLCVRCAAEVKATRNERA